MVRTLVRSPSRRQSRSRKRMTPGSTRKNLDFDNSQRRSRSRRVSTLRKSPSFKQSDRRQSLGSTRKTLKFSPSRTRNIKTRKKPYFGPPRRVLTRKIKGSPKRVKRRVKKTPKPRWKYGGKYLKKQTKRKNGGHHSFFW